MMRENKTKPWFVLAVCCGLAASSMGILCNSVGVFYNPVSESLGVLKGSFTMHMTICSIFAAVTALFVGPMMNRYPFKLLLLFGMVLSSVSTFMMGYASTLWHFYVLGAIRGIGLNFFCMIPITMIISNWFEKSTGLATSLVMSFSGIAGAIGSPVFSYLITNFGWQWAYQVMGIATLVIALPAVLYPYSLNPEKDGLLPYGATSLKKEKQNLQTSITSKFKANTMSFALFVVFAVGATAITCLPQYFPGFAESIGQSAAVGSMMLSLSMIGNITSKLIIGFLSDKIGEVKSSIVMLLINLIAIVMMLFASNSMMLMVGSFLFGSIFSIGAVGIALLTKKFFGLDNYSQAYSKVNVFTGLAGAFAASFIGYIYDFTQTYSTAFILFIIVHILIFACLSILIKKQEK